MHVDNTDQDNLIVPLTCQKIGYSLILYWCGDPWWMHLKIIHI